MKEKEIVKSLVTNALVAAIYVVITLVEGDFAYMGVQIRFAEALILLAFFRRDYIVGLTLGCLIANMGSSLLPWDLIFGTLATLLSAIIISFMKQLFIATLVPVIINGFVVGAELYFILEQPFWINVGFVALGEFIAISIIGYIIFMIFGKRKGFQNLIGATRNLEFKW